jgi:hypothetical protein
LCLHCSWSPSLERSPPGDTPSSCAVVTASSVAARRFSSRQRRRPVKCGVVLKALERVNEASVYTHNRTGQSKTRCKTAESAKTGGGTRQCCSKHAAAPAGSPRPARDSVRLQVWPPAPLLVCASKRQLELLYMLVDGDRRTDGPPRLCMWTTRARRQQQHPLPQQPQPSPSHHHTAPPPLKTPRQRRPLARRAPPPTPSRSGTA